MKKNYIVPQIGVQKIKVAQMFATSPTPPSGQDQGDYDSNNQTQLSKDRDNFLDSSNGMNALW